MNSGQDSASGSSQDNSEYSSETPYVITSSEETERADYTNDMYEEQAMLLVKQLIERGVIELGEKEPLLYHRPSGRTFTSALNAAHFHKGWTAAEDA